MAWGRNSNLRRSALERRFLRQSVALCERDERVCVSSPYDAPSRISPNYLETRGLCARGDLSTLKSLWQDLTLPARRELTTALKRCDRKGSDEIALRIEATQAKEVRDPTLSLLCSKDYRIRPLRVRGRLLDALIPYAHELPEQAYAMMSFWDRSTKGRSRSARADRTPERIEAAAFLGALLHPTGRNTQISTKDSTR